MREKERESTTKKRRTRRKNKKNLVVEASDGYRAVFALPELDPAYTDKIVMLVDKRDGKLLDAKEGPLRIVVPDEKRHARWVRMVTGLVVKRSS